MRKEKMGMENGRTMAEMLAVISLAGVLSITGIVGYGYAMRLYQEAETMDQLSVLIAGARSWDIPLHFGQKTVGVSDDYMPYVVPIRDVVSRVNFRSEMSAYDAGLTDDEGNLIKDTMAHVREYESFNTLLDTPAWVRAEDEFNWSVRVTGLSYSLCEKLLNKSDLGFDYAYVALQNPNSQTPLDPIMGDFSGVDNVNKYANPAKEIEGGISTKEQIEKVCALLDPSKGSIPPAQTYIRNIDNEEKATVASGAAEGVCKDKKSLGCMAFGARIYNEKTKQVDQPLQTLVFYFGSGDDMPPCVGEDCPNPFPPSTCLKGTPYTAESGGKIESEECCQSLGGTYFIPGIPKCCKLVENIENTPRCKLGPDGLYAINVGPKIDSLGNPVVDANGNPVFEEKMTFETDSITSEEVIYIGGNWAGAPDKSCCPARVIPLVHPRMCHKSSITGSVLPWALIPGKGATSSQYQNCPHSVSAQTSNITSEVCCTGSGEYWSEAEGTSVGTVLSSDTGQALCCSKNSIFDYHAVSTPDQCPWKPVSNIPSTANPQAGAEPKDMYGANTTACCYKSVGQKGILKNTACAYEGGVLKYSASCCNISTDAAGNKLKYVYAPNYVPGGVTSQECGLFAGGATKAIEPDRNCCVDYIEVDKVNPLNPHSVIKDWSGMPSPQYCCETLIGTNLAATEIEMKNNYKNCCESDLYFATKNINIRSAATFVPAGTSLQGYATVFTCPHPLTGTSCTPNGPHYTTTDNLCCDVETGLTSDGAQNKVCCDYASLHSKTAKLHWTGSACAPCPKGCVNTDWPDPDPDKCHDICEYEEEVEREDIPPKVTPTCDTTKGCFIGRADECCQATGYDAKGYRTCLCCLRPEAEGVNHGDGCFFINGTPSRIDPKPECLSGEVSPGISTPSYTVIKTKILKTYECPVGVPAGTKVNVGPCPEGGVIGGKG